MLGGCDTDVGRVYLVSVRVLGGLEMGFLIGLIIGCLAGIFVTALCTAASKADDKMEDWGDLEYVDLEDE